MPQNSKEACAFCVEKIKKVDYKDIERLRNYVSLQGKVLSRKRTRLCAKHQRQLARAVKRARHLALLPFVRR